MTDGPELVVVFSELANYVQARSGNAQLNFANLVICHEFLGNLIDPSDMSMVH